MKSTYQSPLSLYSNLVKYVRRLRETPNSLAGIRFTQYLGDPDVEYIANIKDFFVSKRYANEYPPEIGAVSTISSKYAITPGLNIKAKTTFGASCYCSDRNNSTFDDVVARSIAYITSGQDPSIVNKEMYLMRLFAGVKDYEKQNKVVFDSGDVATILQNTNKCMGLESYLFYSEGQKYVLMESEINSPTGLKQKSYIIVNPNAFAKVIFGAKGSVQEKYFFVSQTKLSIEDAQSFVDGDLKWVCNCDPNDIEGEKEQVLLKFNDLKENEKPLVIFEDARGNSDNNTYKDVYYTKIYSPTAVKTKDY